MWNYKKLRSDGSPLAQIISFASSKRNIRFVIYHLGKNQVELATEMGDCNNRFHLDSSIVREMINDGKEMKDEAIRHGMRLPQGTDEHALLAFDLGGNNVFLIQTAPELQVVSSILMGMVSELMAASTPSEHVRCGRTIEDKRNQSYDEEMLKRESEIEAEAKGFARRMAAKEPKRERFIPKNEGYEHPLGDGSDAPIGIVGLGHSKIGLV